MRGTGHDGPVHFHVVVVNCARAVCRQFSRAAADSARSPCADVLASTARVQAAASRRARARSAERRTSAVRAAAEPAVAMRPAKDGQHVTPLQERMAGIAANPGVNST